MNRKHALGFISIEMIFTIAVIIGLMGLGLSYLEQSATGRNDQVAADQARLMSDATSRWAKDNYATVLGVASPTATYPSSVLASYLPQGYVPSNIYGQGYSIRALKTAANSLEFMLVTTGGETIPVRSLRRIAGKLAPTGGFITTATPTTAEGAGGGWSVPMSNYGGSPGGGHLAIGLFFKDGEMSVPDFLYRNPVAGHAEYNRMNTAIDMGANNINNVATVNAGNVAAGADVTALGSVNGSNLNASVAVNAPYIHATGDVAANGSVSVGGEVYAQGWFRSLGDSGWYNQKWGGGLYMVDPTWIRAYADKSIYTGGEVRASSLRTTGFLQVDGIAAANAGCSQQGQEARDATGSPLYCISGIWRKIGGGTLVGYGHSDGTDQLYVYPPAGASVATHRIFVIASEYNQCNWEAQHASNWSFEMTNNGPILLAGSQYCPSWSQVSYLAIATPR